MAAEMFVGVDGDFSAIELEKQRAKKKKKWAKKGKSGYLDCSFRNYTLTFIMPKRIWC